MRSKILILLLTFVTLYSSWCTAKDKYDIVAYVWPSCHNDPLGEKYFWEQGIGEWQVIKTADPRFVGHYQPKQPLWGYESDADPKVMKKWIRVASCHGVDVFVFDWYWYQGGPFLEDCVNAFVAAKTDKMQFYLMWANHDASNGWNFHKYGSEYKMVWPGTFDKNQYPEIVDRIITKFMKQPNYYKIDGCPVLNIWDMKNFLKNFDMDVSETNRAIAYFRSKVKEAGFPDLYLQGMTHEFWTVDFMSQFDLNGTAEYGWPMVDKEDHAIDMQDYQTWADNGYAQYDRWDALGFHAPSVSIGWDDSPRYLFKQKEQIMHINRDPEHFATALRKAKAYCDAHPENPSIITIYAFNEWVEDAYLLPDKKYGFGYLNALKKVMRE